MEIINSLIERLRDWYNTSDECNRKDMTQAADLLERIYSQPVELPEPVECDGDSGAQIYTADQLTQAVQEATARALEALEQIQHSVKQARVVGNDWRRELELIENTASDAIRNLIGRC